MLFLDTFDGRVTAAGGRQLLRAHDTQTRVEWQPRDRQVRLESHVTGPVAFAWDLPPGPLRNGLEPLIEVRRLLPQVEVEIGGRLLGILDGDRKTVARIRIESGRARVPGRARLWHRIPTVVTLTAVRGYDLEYKRLVPIVESRPGLERTLAGLLGITFRRWQRPRLVMCRG